MHSMLRGIYMLLWDTNSLRDNLQTAADVKNKRGPASLFPYIYLIDSYSTSFGVHLTSLGKANLFLAFHLSLALVPSCFTHLRARSSYSFIAKGTPRPVTRGGARGAFAPPPPTGLKGPHFDTQYPV